MMKKTKLKALLLSITVISVLAFASGVSAGTFSDTIKPDNGIIFKTTTAALINPILLWVFGIIGIICVVMIVYAGIKITTSGEKEDQRRKAIQTLTWALIGLVIVLIAYSLVNIIGTGITGALTSPSSK